jgi:hypothetical protein
VHADSAAIMLLTPDKSSGGACSALAVSCSLGRADNAVDVVVCDALAMPLA